MTGFIRRVSLETARSLVQRALDLPTPLRKQLVGKWSHPIQGRELDPRLQVASAVAERLPALDRLGPRQARRATDLLFQLVDVRASESVKVEERLLPGVPPVRVRIYRPPEWTDEMPVLVYAHMGGFVIGTLETCHAFCALLAERARCIVVSVDYRRAPEHKFPAAFDDVAGAFEWATLNAATLGGDPARVGLGGDSAGGLLSAAVTLDRRRNGASLPKLQLLIYPATDVSREFPSYETYGHAQPLTRELIHWFTAQYVSDPAERLDLRLSPARAEDLSGLSPALIITAGFDPLCDDGEDYARRLREAGNEVIVRRYSRLCHGFVSFGGVPVVRRTLQEIAADVRDGLHG